MIIYRLVSGWYHIRGHGPCDCAQVPVWPCDEATLREHAFPEASEEFLLDVIRMAEKERRGGELGRG